MAKAKKLWGGVFKQPTDPWVERFSRSIGFDWKLARYDVAGSIVYAEMLGRARILSRRESGRLVAALKEILREIEGGRFVIDKTAEDIHTHIENVLSKKLGALGGKLHTGRSRNDQVALDLRLYVKEELGLLAKKVCLLQKAFVSLAKKYQGVIVPGYTHLQRAQGILWAHELLAVVEMLERDRERLECAVYAADELPLGSGALAGSGLPLDRAFLARRLGFSRVSANSVDAVGDRDFAVEALYALALLGVHLSRWAEGWALWASSEFNFLILDERFQTGSSLMPQKRNPDVLELIRGASGRLTGNLVSILVTLKGLPLSYQRDLQHDKEPLFDSVERMGQMLDVAARLVSRVRLNTAAVMLAVSDEGLVATDLVEYLVEKGVAFRQAHEAVGRLLREAQEEGKQLREMPIEAWRRFSGAFSKDVYARLSAEASVRAKRTAGSTSPREVEKNLARWGKILARV